MSLKHLQSFSDQIDAFLWPEEDAKQRSKRERILQAASDLFVRLGYRKTSVDEVAKLAGIAKGTVYLYYRSKAELVFHAIALEKKTYLGRLAPLRDASLSPRERLRSLVALALTVSREMPLSMSLTQGDREIELAFAEIDEQALGDITDLQVNVLIELLDEATDNRLAREVLRARSEVLLDLMLAVSTSKLVNANRSNWAGFAGVLADMIIDGVVGSSAAMTGKSVKYRGAA